LLVKYVLNFIRSGMTGLHAKSKWSDGTSDKDFARSRFAGFAGNFYPARIEALHFVCEAERRELEAIRAKSIRLDDLCASFDVCLMNPEDSFGLGGVEFIKASLRADRFVQHRTHRAIGDENRIFQPFVKVENFQLCSALLL